MSMDLRSIRYTRAVIGGAVGTLAMTLSCLIGFPALGIVPIPPVGFLTDFFWHIPALGWISHFAIGIVLAICYGAVQGSIPGPAPVRGILFSLIPWVIFQVMILPLLGEPLFMNSIEEALLSVVRHSIYGAILGEIYGNPPKTKARR